MSSRLDSILSITLTGAAVVMVCLLGYRVLFVEAARGSSATARPPVLLSGWDSIAAVGHRLGPLSAPVTIIEFSDFECPACRAFNDAVGSVTAEYPNAITRVFVHYPLSQHRFARPAARAAECAASQDRFAAMHDLLFSKQDSLGLKAWAAFAEDARIPDPTAFAKCVEATAAISRVEQGLALGQTIDVTGTPTLIVNGWRYFHRPGREELRVIVGRVLQGQSPVPVN